MSEVLLSGADAQAMLEFYRDEHVRASQRLSHIEEMLAKLGGSVPAGKTAKGAESRKVTVPKRKYKKKTGPKSVWGNYVVKRLRQLDKPVSYEDLITDAMNYFKIPDNQSEKARQAIVNTTFRLRKTLKKIDTFRVPGQREKFLVLKSWYEKGTLKPEYAKRAQREARDRMKAKKAIKDAEKARLKAERAIERKKKRDAVKAAKLAEKKAAKAMKSAAKK